MFCYKEMNGGWGMGGGGSPYFFSDTMGGHQIHVCCSNFYLKGKFSIPVKSLCCVSVQCIVVVMWNSAQCYSVVCGEDKLLFTFTVFISQDIVTENKGIEADWAQSTFFSVNTLRSFSI